MSQSTPNAYMCACVRDFVRSLKPADRELFDAVINDFVQDASPAMLGKLNDILTRVKKQIDRINHKRSGLVMRVARIDRALKMLQNYPHNSEFVTAVLAEMLQTRRYELRAEIEELKPEVALATKYRLKRKQEASETRLAFSQLVINAVTATPGACATEHANVCGDADEKETDGA